MSKQRNCDHCSRPFTSPGFAPGKRFCCGKCRQDWHHKQRQLAMAMQQQLTQALEEGEGLYDRLAAVTGVGREDVKRVVLALGMGAGNGGG